MTTKHTRLGSAFFALAMMGVASTSVGAPGETSAPKKAPMAFAPAFAGLPTASFRQIPAKKDIPKQVNAASRVDGIFFAYPKASRNRHNPPGLRYVGMFVNEEDAAAHREDKLDRWGRRPDDASYPQGKTVCFDVLNHWELQRSDRAWSHHSLEQWPQIRSAVKGSAAAKQAPDYQKPVAFRVERLVTDDTDTAKLHVKEAWFDPVTLGAREIATYAADFERVATGPSGVQVFAARAKDGNSVELLVYRPEVDKKIASARGRHMSTRRGNGHSSSDCGHSRLSLRTSPGLGEHGAVQLDVVMPQTAEQKRTYEQALKQHEADPKKHPKPSRELTVRQLMVNMGVSQGLKEKTPTISIAFTFHGKPRTVQIF